MLNDIRFNAGQAFTNAHSSGGGYGAQGSAADPAGEAWKRIQAQTTGRSAAIDTDPRVTAAMDYLDPAKVQATSYARSTDQNAAHAGAIAEMQRQQFAAAGISANDPAAQARMRQVETQRMQNNNASLTQSQQAGQGAAAQQAQLRLSQLSLANQPLAQGTAYEAQKDYGTGSNQSAGYSRAVSSAGGASGSNTNAMGGTSATSWWQPTAAASSPPATATRPDPSAGAVMAQAQQEARKRLADQQRRDAETNTAFDQTQAELDAYDPYDFLGY